MQKSRIIQLVNTLPQRSQIYALQPARVVTSRVPTDMLLHRRASALLDPAFAWHYAEAFAQSNQPLPETVTEPYIRTAHEYLMDQTWTDDFADALVLRHPNWELKRGFVEALSLFSDVRLDQISNYTGLSVFVIQLYQNLFWNVRDRLADPLFINHLVFPQTRQIEFKPDYWLNATPSQLMLRAAFHRDLPTVLNIFGCPTSAEPMSAGDLTNELKTNLLAAANHVIKSGGINQGGVPALEAARKLLIASERNPVRQSPLGEDRLGLSALGSLNPGESILETVRRMNDDSEYNKRLNHQLLEQLAKEPSSN
jgi:hypothetical protein